MNNIKKAISFFYAITMNMDFNLLKGNKSTINIIKVAKITSSYLATQ